MSVQKIIKESMEKNPLNLKEALQEELKARMSLALEAKMKEMEDEDELDESIKVGDKVKIAASGLKGFPGRGGKIGTVTKDYGDGDFKVNMGGNDDISISGDDLIKEAYDDEDELEEAKGTKPFFGVKDGKAYAVSLSNAKGGNEPRNMGWLMDNNTIIKEFMKDAKKHYVDAKGKATLPAVKKAVKMLGATEFYATWKADSPSYKDDSFVLYYKG